MRWGPWTRGAGVAARGALTADAISVLCETAAASCGVGFTWCSKESGDLEIMTEICLRLSKLNDSSLP